ncbi:hypothetical protein A2767_06555 [Candidatus Roizmanbacteria bacterium RIFCSPHIGHO2_01_FULL_35_10]|nr:MAG: hypothetical protein A2767_06555 [Candidatus Roizmanbacteria bacterium RIFCSPHIGHO2_01_FULL_35_10]
MQNQIPNNWQKIKLGEIAQDIRDLYEPKKTESLKYIGLEHIEQNSLRLYGAGNSADTQSTKKIFGKNDILFGTLRSYFRKIVKPKFSGVCSTDIAVIRAKKNHDQSFLFYFLANPYFIRYASSPGEGTKMPRAKWNYLSNTQWVIPKLEEQKRMGSFLSAYDDKIELNNKIAKTLEDMAQTIFKEWFVNKQNVNNSIIKDITFVKTGNRPEKLNDIKDKSHSVPVYGANEIMGYTSKTLYNTRIIITGRVGTIGKIFIVNEPSWPSDNVLILIPKNNDYFYFLYFLAKRINYLSLNRGSSQPLIAQSDIENYLIYLPDQTKVKRFNSLVSNLFVLKKIKENENKKLVALRDLLLPKLMKGEIKL